MPIRLTVIGGGPGGYTAAFAAARAGMSVTLVESGNLGGTCLNNGCIPTKTLLHASQVYYDAVNGAGVGVHGSLSYDIGEMFAFKRSVSEKLRSGIHALLKGAKVDVIEGTAQIAAPGQVDVTGADGAVTRYTAERILAATGSVNVRPPIPGLELPGVMTSDELLEGTDTPYQSIVIIGGGVIGLEMASYFCSAGSKVTVIEMMNKIAGPTDAEISKILQKNYEKKGVTFLLGAKVTSVTDKGVNYELNGKTETVEADKVLLSIGRRPATHGLGLENIGVEMNRGAILTDEQCRTNVAGVFATGDCNGKMMLAHVAYRESEVAVNTMLGKKDRMRYTAVPSVIYTNPEVAFVGLTEEAAKAAGMDVACISLTMKYSGRYVAENEGGDGICKLVIDKKNNRLVGVHMIGNYSSEIIVSAVAMLETEMRIEDIKELIFPHPTVCEIIREGIFQYK